MAAADFLSRNHDVTLIFFDHGTETSEQAREFITEYADRKDLPLEIGEIQSSKPTSESLEEYWRNERYAFFRKFPWVITAHHLDDCVENWIWSSLHGDPKVIPYFNAQVFRPFRLNRKQVFIDWATRHNVPWIEDISNQDTKHMRNYIRHELLEKCLVVNPGLHKVVARKVENRQ